MNKAEKKLAKKILDFYNSSSKSSDGFTPEESIIIERWLTIGIANKNAFHDITNHDSVYKEFIQTFGYPFTSLGDEEIKKNWYLNFRDSKGIIIVRDTLAAISFLVALYVAISNFIQ